MQFENPPLVELIAELRWNPSLWANVNQTSSQQNTGSPLAHQDVFFSKFAAAVSRIKFSSSERLVPQGFAYPPFQPVYRFRKEASDEDNVLYSIGPGVFSANALPPYRNWDAFRPVIQNGVTLALEFRPQAETGSPFLAVALRYLNLFSGDLLGELSIGAFIRDVLKVKIDLPPELSRHSTPNADIKPNLQFGIPLTNGSLMALQLAEGLINDRRGVLMDIAIVKNTPTDSRLETVMEAYDDAHEKIQDTFKTLASALFDKMKPLEAL